MALGMALRRVSAAMAENVVDDTPTSVKTYGVSGGQDRGARISTGDLLLPKPVRIRFRIRVNLGITRCSGGSASDPVAEANAIALTGEAAAEEGADFYVGDATVMRHW
jgi:hypothetical protein